jgi:hypothetical protein
MIRDTTGRRALALTNAHVGRIERRRQRRTVRQVLKGAGRLWNGRQR